MVDEVLTELSWRFDTRCTPCVGRLSIAAEKLLRAQLLQMLYSEFLARAVEQARAEELTSGEHFTIDGTLPEAISR
jgi:hypothetical protein